MKQFKEGDLVVWDNGAATYVRQEKTKWGDHIIKLHPKVMEDNCACEEQEVEDAHLESFVPLTIEDVATVYKPGEEIKSNPWGYIVVPDGTTYGLNYQWYHGIVLAIIFPEDAKKAGFPPPGRGAANVYFFQKFETRHSHHISCIRVAFGYMTAFAVSRSGEAATEEQLTAMRSIFKARNKKLTDKVTTDYRDMSVRETLKFLARKPDKYDDES